MRSLVINSDPRIVAVFTDAEAITVHLADGRVVSVPPAWSWRLSRATPEQRSNFEIIGNSHGVHWPTLSLFDQPNELSDVWNLNIQLSLVDSHLLARQVVLSGTQSDDWNAQRS